MPDISSVKKKSKMKCCLSVLSCPALNVCLSLLLTEKCTCLLVCSFLAWLCCLSAVPLSHLCALLTRFCSTCPFLSCAWVVCASLAVSACCPVPQCVCIPSACLLLSRSPPVSFSAHLSVILPLLPPLGLLFAHVLRTCLGPFSLCPCCVPPCVFVLSAFPLHHPLCVLVSSLLIPLCQLLCLLASLSVGVSPSLMSPSLSYFLCICVCVCVCALTCACLWAPKPFSVGAVSTVKISTAGSFLHDDPIYQTAPGSRLKAKPGAKVDTRGRPMMDTRPKLKAATWRLESWGLKWKTPETTGSRKCHNVQKVALGRRKTWLSWTEGQAKDPELKTEGPRAEMKRPGSQASLYGPQSPRDTAISRLTRVGSCSPLTLSPEDPKPQDQPENLTLSPLVLLPLGHFPWFLSSPAVSMLWFPDDSFDVKRHLLKLTTVCLSQSKPVLSSVWRHLWRFCSCFFF